MTLVISKATIDLLINSSNIKSNSDESYNDKIKKLIENGLLLSNTTYQIKDTNELVNITQKNNNIKLIIIKNKIL
jgi:hypothetical protein